MIIENIFTIEFILNTLVFSCIGIVTIEICIYFYKKITEMKAKNFKKDNEFLEKKDNVFKI